MKMEPFRMEQQETNGQFVLKLGGELDLAVVPQLQAAVEPYLRRTDLAMVLDLEGLKYIDSTGIGIIVSILKTRDSVNAPFYVRHIPPTVRRLFDMTGLSGYLKEEAGA
ncbi:anti-sigma factor antagonist [Paenibacillus pinisoli]|uniref:Anti-sigma factor antagonist n=2 Tax=Paenibacillus pinisoli TaxID=1276110 RepID=A0A3A6PTI1_9BACL|nr:STAS domain-containing protein [Paenibacillus pinisoli]RJX39053.1 anti-sigma factor antagonist [Paenibacillus pinisoli]